MSFFWILILLVSSVLFSGGVMFTMIFLWIRYGPESRSGGNDPKEKNVQRTLRGQIGRFMVHVRQISRDRQLGKESGIELKATKASVRKIYGWRGFPLMASLVIPTVILELFIIWIIIECSSSPIKNEIFWALSILVCTFSALYLSFGRVTNIDTGHAAILKIYGWRVPYISLQEGPNWIVPFADTEVVETRERLTKLGYTNDTEEAKGITVHCKDLIPVFVHGEIPWSIEDVYTVTVKTTKFIHEYLQAVAEKELREEAGKVSSERFVLNLDPKSKKKNGKAKELALRVRSEAEKSARDWGIRMGDNGLIVTRMILPPEIVKAKKQIEIEKSQKTAETIEIRLVAKLVKMLVDLGIPADKAANMVANERGKMDRSEHIFSGLENMQQFVGFGGIPGFGPGTNARKKARAKDRREQKKQQPREETKKGEGKG